MQASRPDGTATAPDDYTAVNTLVTFPPTTTTQQVVVPVVGDTLIEGTETFTVDLSNASVGIADGTGLGTITDNDAPALSINDVAAPEGLHGVGEDRPDQSLLAQLRLPFGRQATHLPAGHRLSPQRDGPVLAGVARVQAGRDGAGVVRQGPRLATRGHQGEGEGLGVAVLRGRMCVHAGSVSPGQRSSKAPAYIVWLPPPLAPVIPSFVPSTSGRDCR